MPLSAVNFINNRKKVVVLTDNRISHIISYIVECYNLLMLDKPSFSKSFVAQNTTFHFEDYLKMEFVDNYLIKKKQLLAAKLSSLEKVTFNYETIQRFTDTSDGKEKSDKIDVYVNRLGLKDEWAVDEEHLYLAIECKRIGILSDCQEYIGDIEKFCNRDYSRLRIPFESQIAFIESSKIDHSAISANINSRLKSSTTIITKKPLTSLAFSKTFGGSYFSIHKKTFKKKGPFKVFHLLFDYSQLVTN